MKVLVFTSTRAEYGLLNPLIRQLEDDSYFDVKILVTGSHLMAQFGNTVSEIEKEHSNLLKVALKKSGDSPGEIVESMASGLCSYSECISSVRPNIVIILGDRFEALACAISAVINNIPIVHIHGGELTEGAIDDSFRHSITKMSALHFTSTEEYWSRVIQLGENPRFVFNSGALAAENIETMPLLYLEDLKTEVGFDLEKPYFLITYHPETIDGGNPKIVLDELILALKQFKSHKFVITYPNTDPEHEIIIKTWEAFSHEEPGRVLLTTSLGCLRYLSCMKYADAVIGNSSSGIIEAPILKVPTINIGDRQKGRLETDSIINVQGNSQSITSGIEKAFEIKSQISEMPHPYGDGNTSSRIIEVLKLMDSKLTLKKSFYDIKN